MKFLEGCSTAEEAEDRAPSAVVLIECDGGWMAFDSDEEWETWDNQR